MRRALMSAMLAIALAAQAAGSAKAQDAERLDVIELFTSQACSACPPADELLGKLAQQEGVLALSYSVDYWNYLEWEDTLSEPDFSARQRGYAKGRGDRKVYTPQAVINGAVHAVGSDQEALAEALIQTGQSGDPVPLSVTRDNASSIVVSVGPAPDTMGPIEATIWLVVYADRRTVQVQGGENKGRMLTYHNVVRRIEPIGTWQGDRLTRTIELPERAGEQSAILLQQGDAKRPGAIISAARP